ncbi:MAG: hydrogenase [Desulfovibrio sp.]|nr:hydrogenase [Desulfovibrio sp.]MBI4958948.1 hydrogenase [Desulfovibrio sp.]
MWQVCTGAGSQFIQLPWFLPWGHFSVAADPVSIFFLVPVFIIPTLGSLYGWEYWKHSDHPQSGRRIILSYGFLAGAMALVVLARDGVLFLIVWECMAVSAYFAATAEENNPDVRQAGWVYLIATHMGTLCLLAMFALWRHATGSFGLEAAQAIPGGLAGSIFVLALIGFGFKAGLMPVHVWLPGAHANAPSHVSAVMSGVMLKMGIYGIVRMTALLPIGEAWWGAALLVVGAVSAMVGIAFAMGQRDIKRLLAYSSIENIGIVAMGLGLALLGRSFGRPELIALGLGGALFHVWNHSLFKSLLFFNAGAVIHAAHTRDMDRLGGLAKQMPRVASLFFAGAVAISALPPLNGFAGEWLLYLGFFRGLDQSMGKAGAAVGLAAVVLASVGAMVLACFVKAFGSVFLGSPRSDTMRHINDPHRSMLIPMVLLTAGCLGLGLVPMAAAPMLEKAVQAWSGSEQLLNISFLAAFAPLPSISAVGLLFVVIVAAFIAVAIRLIQTNPPCKAPTWDCGYSRPTARIQYTGTSFVQSLVRLFRFVLLPKFINPALRGYFPERTQFRVVIIDVVLDRFAVPLFHASGRFFSSLRIMQQGHTHLYLMYIVSIVLILMMLGSL